MRHERRHEGGDIDGRGEGDKPVRSERQRLASIANGSRSKGPRPENRERVKLNGLVHGLRAEQLILPGEDPAEFEALRGALHDEWDPATLTRALLVDRLAVAAWRLRRATRADVAYRRVTAEGAALASDAERRRRVDRALERIFDEPTAALADLESHALGLDRLTTAWAELEAALARGPSAWDRPFYHDRLMLLHGRQAEADPALIGPAGRASAKLLAANQPGGAAPAAGEAEEAAAEIGRVVVENLGRLRGLRARVPDPEEQRRQMIDAAMVDDSAGAQLRLRYEMAIERSMRSTIKQLMELRRSGADLNEPDDPGPSAVPESQAPPPEPSPSPPAGAAPSMSAPGLVGAGESRPARRRPDPQQRLREVRRRSAGRPRKGGSTP